MNSRPSRWIGVALGIGLVLVLLAPVALLHIALRPEPWDARHLRVRFESVRPSSAQADDAAGRAAAGLALVGFPVRLPLDIERTNRGAWKCGWNWRSRVSY